MVIVVDKDEYEAKTSSDTTVESALEDTAEGGRIGSLQVDPQSLTMRAPGMIQFFLLSESLLNPDSFFQSSKSPNLTETTTSRSLDS